MTAFKLRIATPDGNVFSGDAEMLSLRGIEGELAVLAGHIPLLTAVCPGKCRVTTDGKVREADISGGMLSVGKDRVTLLADVFSWKQNT